MLVPQSFLNRADDQLKRTTFSGLPKGLLRTLARSPVRPCQPVGSLDRVEAWLLKHLDPLSKARFEQYPAWAMLGNSQALAFTQFFVTLGCLELERDGVSFTPPEDLQVSPQDVASFWAVVTPLLQEQGWCIHGALGLHVCVSHDQAVPMEQPSPWSVQGVRLTDYLPMSPECAQWRRMWLNIQVALHHAPLNQARQAKGLRSLNALWFWGAGQPWQAQAPMPHIKSVSVDGVCDARVHTESAGQALNRFVFWAQLLGELEFAEGEKPCTVYCLDFDGWGGCTDVFSVLALDVLEPLRLAGLPVHWVLMGESAWREVQSNGLQRLKFWKHAPNWNHLGETHAQTSPSEEQLRAAWQQGLHEQDQIQAEWEGRV